MLNTSSETEELVKCPVCDIYLKKAEGFICATCRRGPLCSRHRIAGARECASCVFDRRKKDLIALREQEQNLRGFLRLLQFLFLVFAIFFIAARTGLEEMAEFIQDSFMKDGILYLGGIAIVGYGIFYLILYSQRSSISELETEIRKIELRR